jgi:hypothetical protein
LRAVRGAEPELSTAENYRRWGSQVAEKSPLYAALCDGVAADRELLAFLDARPPQKRQPNLLLAAVRLLYGLQPDYPAFRAAVLAHPDEVATVLETRRTQTNEPGRCAPMLPLLAALPQPLALLEVGASAGLCLLPDRYAYDYAGYRVGAAAVVFPCRTEGSVPLPSAPPRVAWRVGIDLAPVDVADRDAVAWLEALVWPEETDRLERLRAALAIARADPPRVVRGDLVERLPALAAEAPRDATLVVFHTAVLAYLTTEQREQLGRRAHELGATWIACEAPGVLPALGAAESGFVLGVDGRRVATCDSHGRWLRWGG